MSVLEVVYDSGHKPSLTSARDVLAFLLVSPRTVVPDADADELAAVDTMLRAAKREALQQWFTLQRSA